MRKKAGEVSKSRRDLTQKRPLSPIFESHQDRRADTSQAAHADLASFGSEAEWKIVNTGSLAS